MDRAISRTRVANTVIRGKVHYSDDWSLLLVYIARAICVRGVLETPVLNLAADRGE